jgi:hypothetical protein
MTTLEQYTAALRAFILQRPGFEPANYGGCASAYRADYSRCLADRDDALELLAHVTRASDSATMQASLADALRSGRMEWNADAQAFDYCTGQYFPTEYRNAACQLLARALWAYWRDASAANWREAMSNADNIRRTARNALGKRLARRWFA